MRLCYIDESGTPDLPGNTSHYVLAGLSVPVWHWKDCDRDLEKLKARYSLQNGEIHTGWILRRYLEQSKIDNFKNIDERRKLITDVAECTSKWGFARLFAECIDKIHFDPSTVGFAADEQAFEQVISRFEQYLQAISQPQDPCYGLLIHDNNPTVEKKHTALMKGFLSKGTLWTSVTNTIETPLYVNSELTALIQVADLCAYALRRYLENGEEDLFNLVFERADRKNGVVVGVRHFTSSDCSCAICSTHRQQ